MWSLLVDLISGRRMGAVIGFGGMRLLSCPDLLPLLGSQASRPGVAVFWAAAPALCVADTHFCGYGLLPLFAL